MVVVSPHVRGRGLFDIEEFQRIIAIEEQSSFDDLTLSFDVEDDDPDSDR